MLPAGIRTPNRYQPAATPHLRADDAGAKS
jgi:hypothetical protein